MADMSLDEITILERHDDRIVVGSDMLSYSKDYPLEIVDGTTRYVWDGKIPMDQQYIGHYFSTAVYKGASHA